jgi:HEAT repeat protein
MSTKHPAAADRKGDKIMKRLKTILTFFVVINLMVPWCISEALGQTSSADEVENLIKDMKNESWQIRWDTAAALGETKDPRAIESLSAALKDENSYVRMTAARSLGMIDDPRVIDPLIEALRDESHGVKKNAALALKIRTGQDFGKDPDAWQKWWEQNK